MSFFSPVNQARWARFRHNRRGYWSLWLFLILFFCSLGAELLANDRPLLVQYRGQLYVPVLKNYTEQTFGGAFATAADYQDPWLQHQLSTHGWALWPPVRFGATTINFASTVPFPSPPSASNWLGTDANGGDVLARILYGTRISVLFGLLLTLFLQRAGGAGRGDTGLLWRQNRPLGPALYRSLVRDADPVSDHPALQRRAAGLLVVAGDHRPFWLDDAGGRGAR